MILERVKEPWWNRLGTLYSCPVALTVLLLRVLLIRGGRKLDLVCCIFTWLLLVLGPFLILVAWGIWLKLSWRYRPIDARPVWKVWSEFFWSSLILFCVIDTTFIEDLHLLAKMTLKVACLVLLPISIHIAHNSLATWTCFLDRATRLLIVVLLLDLYLDEWIRMIFVKIGWAKGHLRFFKDCLLLSSNLMVLYK